ncbi:nucleolin 1 [Brassica napus]|nr:nucleolin 1 [Brassica napus]
MRINLYVNEEDEEKALTFDGSDMGGSILRVTAYPFDSNRLDHFFATPEAQDKYRQRVLNVTGFDTSLARDEVEEMVRSVFPGSYCSVLGEVVFVHLRGKDAIEKALKLSGRSAGGFNLVVNAVLPLRKDGGGGVSRARMLAMAKKDEAGRLAEAARLAKIKRTKAARLAKAETAKASRLAMAEKDKAILSEGNQKSIMTTD